MFKYLLFGLLCFASIPVQAEVLFVTDPQTCIHCKKMEPVVRKFKEEGEDIKTVDVNTTKGAKIAKAFKVRAFPTFISVVKVKGERKEVAREEGELSPTRLQKLLNRSKTKTETKTKTKTKTVTKA